MHQISAALYSELYPGIDLVFYGAGNDIEHDFVIAPGADPRSIHFAVNGTRNVKLTRGGNLEIELGGSTLRFKKPVAFQDINGERRYVAADFVMAGGTVGFKVASYDRTRILTIDPLLSVATYLDGGFGDQIYAIATDAAGYIYATGTAYSPAFPTQNAMQPACAVCPDVFVAKLSPEADRLIFSTYLGGNYGETATAIAVDATGNVIVAGHSASPDFPKAGNLVSQVSDGQHQGHFLASLRPDGSGLNYAGTIGGASSSNLPWNALALDNDGTAYLAGQTDNTQFPVTPGTLSMVVVGYPFISTFVLKVDKTGRLAYSTVIPGNAPQPSDTHSNFNNDFKPNDIAVDLQGNVTIAGDAGRGLPTTAGVILPEVPGSAADFPSGFLLKLNAYGSAVIFATYVPDVLIAALARDAAGDYYVTGNTSSTTLAGTANAFQKTIKPGLYCTCAYGYVLKLSSDAKTILAGSYLTGTPSDSNVGTEFTSLALDSHSNVIVAGSTRSADYPMKNPLMSKLPINPQTGQYVATVAIGVLTPDLRALLFGTYLDGTAADPWIPDEHWGLAIDPSDRLLLAGKTVVANFPNTAGGFEPAPPIPPGSIMYRHPIVAKIDLAAEGMFAMSLAADAAPVASGSTALYKIAVAPQDRFIGPVTFTCANLPPYAQCRFNPYATVQVVRGPASVDLYLDTVGATGAPPGILVADLSWFPVLLVLGVAISRCKLGKGSMGVIGVLLVCLLVGCGGGKTQPPPAHTTPPGTYQITLNATSGNISQAMNLTLIVR